jgi:transketolase
MQQAKLKPLTGEELDRLAINCSTAGEVRSPRHADGTAPLVHTFWNRVLHFDPHDPIWPDRDRFE